MKRGEIWTIASGADYAGKPRPAVILQDDLFSETRSVTICSFTTNAVDASAFRLPIHPTPSNGLRSASQLMVDKITTVPKDKLGLRIGLLSGEDMVRLDEAAAVFLGLSQRSGNAGETEDS